MRFYLKSKVQKNWVDITEYVDNPSFINDTVDGAYINAVIECNFSSNVENIVANKPIPPKWELKIVLDDNPEVELVNTFFFITDEQSTIRKRKEVYDGDNNLVLPSLYRHKITANERLYLLEGQYASNYTTTQPKSKYFDIYRKSFGKRFTNLNQVLEQDGYDKSLVKGTAFTYSSVNDGGNTVTIDYDNSKSQYYVELKDIDEVSFNLNTNFSLRATAPSYFERTFIWKTQHNIDVGFNSKSITIKTKYNIIYYDENDNIIDNKEINNDINYQGRQKVEYGRDFIKSFPDGFTDANHLINIEQNKDAKKARVYMSLKSNEEWSSVMGPQTRIPIKSTFDYGGVSYDTYNVLFNLNEIDFKVTSGAYANEQTEKYITIQEFLEKALLDYNLNRRDKITLDKGLEVKLSVPMKEGEWVDYNFKELVERAFKYVGLRPFLTFDNVLTYRQQNKIAKTIDLSQQDANQSEHIGDYFYDRVLNKSKNLVSEKDFVVEIVPVTSNDIEFSQITGDSAGFVLSGNNYFVSNAILHTPDLEFNFKVKENGQTVDRIVKSNMGVDYKWDITSRLFEQDIYNSFPDVRTDLMKTSLTNQVSLRSNPELYSKNNTIFYKSGTNIVGGLGHLSPLIPSYDQWSILAGVPITDNPNYSIIEALIVLAYQTLPYEPKDINDFYVDETLEGDKKQIDKLVNFKLEITYSPIYKELTTKHTSNMLDRRGIDFEKKFNMIDRTVSYDESSNKLRNEMNRKGNVKHLFSEKVRTPNEIIQANSIINDNHYITSRTIQLDNEIFSVDYILQKDFILDNEDTRLPVEFEAYNIPYEYVNREIMLDNHLVFNNKYNERYSTDKKGCNIDFIENVFTKDNVIDNTIYGVTELNYSGEPSKNLLYRVGKIRSGFSMILSGRFADNYSAGLQRYNNEGLYYSQPYRYTDANGKVSSINNLTIGWSETNENTRLKDNNGIYDIKLFPEGKDVQEFDVKLFETDDIVMSLKDAREGISFIHTSYLESENENIKFYNFMNINNIGTLLDEISLIDDLEYNDLDIVSYEDEIDSINVLPTDIINQYMVEVNLKNKTLSDFEKGVVLYNKNEEEYNLVGLIKDPEIENNTLRFYVATTRYGYWKESTIKIPYISLAYIDGEFNYRHKKTITLDMNGEINILPMLSYSISKGTKISNEYLGSLDFTSIMNYKNKKKKKLEYFETPTITLVSEMVYIQNKGIKTSNEYLGSLDFASTINYKNKKNKRGQYLGTSTVTLIGETVYIQNKGIKKTSSNIEETNISSEINYKHKKLDYKLFESETNINFNSSMLYNIKDGENLRTALISGANILSEINYKHKKLDHKLFEIETAINFDSSMLYNIKVGKNLRAGFTSGANILSEINYILKKKKKMSNEYSGLSNISGVLNYDSYKGGNKLFNSNGNISFGTNLTYNNNYFDYKDYYTSNNVAINSDLDYNIIRHSKLIRGFDTNISLNGTLETKHKKTPQPTNYTWKLHTLKPPVSTLCRSLGYNPLGTSCSVLNEVRTVEGRDVGQPTAGCIYIICK